MNTEQQKQYEESRRQERIGLLMDRTYEIRADNPDPAKAGEWAVYAVGGNEHSRRIAYTTNHAEAVAMLDGLLAMHAKIIAQA